MNSTNTLITPPAGLTTPQPSATARGNAANTAKLRKAAGEFEAMLLKSLWKSMKATFSSDDDENSDATMDSFDDLGVETMSDAVGKAGGLGIKNMILKYLEPIAAGRSHGHH